jgi:DNA invertase Pin-like site-specific DNA recombinase
MSNQGKGTMSNIACYIRVSPAGKNQAGQRREINQWLKSNRINPKTVRWYIDKSNSDSLSRRAFEKLQADISDREVSAIVIWRLDRLAPTMRDGLSILSNWSKRPLRIVSVTQNIDFKGGASKPIAAVVKGLAEMAYETKREQSEAGLATARARGRSAGRPGVAADDAKVLKVKQLQKEGKLSIGAICKKLKISRSTYYRYLEL